MAIAYMMGSSVAPHSDPPAIARMQAAMRERMADEWAEKEAKRAASQPKRELKPVGKLTEFAPKSPEKHRHWRSYQVGCFSSALEWGGLFSLLQWV
jgi:hypothetical protein